MNKLVKKVSSVLGVSHAPVKVVDERTVFSLLICENCAFDFAAVESSTSPLWDNTGLSYLILCIYYFSLPECHVTWDVQALHWTWTSTCGWEGRQKMEWATSQIECVSHGNMAMTICFYIISLANMYVSRFFCCQGKKFQNIWWEKKNGKLYHRLTDVMIIHQHPLWNKRNEIITLWPILWKCLMILQ